MTFCIGRRVGGSFESSTRVRALWGITRKLTNPDIP
jgi:hypothetical protein